MPRTKGTYDKSLRSISAPRGFVPVGGIFFFGGKSVVVKERPVDMRPCDACIGCAFASAGCPSIACSAFDRVDGKSVWFESIRNENEER